MVLGHEVSGVLMRESADGLQEEARVAVLAYKACGTCAACLAGRENICADVQHIGHDTGWPEMDHYPGGMAEEFEVWEDFAYQIPDSISFDEATFLDGLAVAIHACDRAKVSAGSRVAVIGLGPIGMMAAQVARDRGASHVTACDTDPLPIRLARDLGLEDALREDALRFLSQRGELDAVIDTVGNSATIEPSLRALRPGGALALLALHSGALTLDSLSLSGERLITTLANNRYADFPHAIELLTERRVRVDSLVTHRFPLSRAVEAFEVMADKEAAGAYKIILHP
jgi:threonine dehydrogenase-like Zn-dependent dehydrogenase